jgi:hypothetical protein
MTQLSRYQEPGFEIPREKVFLGGPVNPRFFENERLPLEESTKELGIMTTCDKRGSSCTRKGRDTIRQNTKQLHSNQSVAYPEFFFVGGGFARNFFLGRGSTNSVEDRGQRER